MNPSKEGLWREGRCDRGVICEASVSEDDSTSIIRGFPSPGGGKTRLDYAIEEGWGEADLYQSQDPPYVPPCVHGVRHRGLGCNNYCCGHK